VRDDVDEIISAKKGAHRYFSVKYSRLIFFHHDSHLFGIDASAFISPQSLPSSSRTYTVSSVVVAIHHLAEHDLDNPNNKLEIINNN